MTGKKEFPYRVAIVGASSLKGKEVKSVLLDRKFPIEKLTLLESDEDLGHLSEFDGEPLVSLALSESSFEFVDLVFFAGSIHHTRSYADLADRYGFLAVDLTHASPADGRIPLFQSGSDSAGKLEPNHGRVMSPHPAALTISSILRSLSRRYDVQNCVINVFQPASERGSEALEELRQQTVDLFSFHKGSRKIFGRQIAFNLLSRYGADVSEPLLNAEETIQAHLKGLLPQGQALPTLTVIQAPIFHCHALSVYLEADTSIEDLESCLESDDITVINTEDEPPSPVDVSGTDHIQVGGIKRDTSRPNGFWLWVVSDNLRLAALNAVGAAESILLTS